MSKRLKLTFCGGVSTVTGANFLLETLDEEKPVKILIDCGMEQGDKAADYFNSRPFPYDPKSIDFLLVTHAHIDHIGLIPKLVKDGFKGIIYSTPETRKIAVPMIEDSTKIMEQEAFRANLRPLYQQEDFNNTFKLWKSIPYHVLTSLTSEFKIYLKDAGHVLGSTIYEITYPSSGLVGTGKSGKIVFTGDLGNSPAPILRDTELVTGANYLVMESVYGDRNHESISERLDKLENIIEETVKRRGALIIPAFSLEKTQVVLYEINKLVEQGRIPVVPVYIDSPLAIKITEIYKNESEDFNPETREMIRRGDDVFNFPKLVFTDSVEESKAIKYSSNPKIIIAGSGMSMGGRIMHHEINYLPHKENTILLLGYQSIGTVGRLIKDGADSITIHGQRVPINAKVEYIDGYSSHKDSDHLLEFVAGTKDTLKKVFVVMGEPKSALFLVQRIRDYLGVYAIHPEEGASEILEF